MVASWKDILRHPLSAEYEDITGPAWFAFTLFLKNFGIVGGRKITLHEGMVLDGWQLLRGCIECNVEPEFQTLPEGTDAETYIEAMNDKRRHQESQESMNRRAEARRLRVAEALHAGESQSSIAKKEKVSRKTIDKDRKKIDEDATVAPPKGKVTGTDGKKYPAKKPKIRCAKCMRLWPHSETSTKQCPQCAELRKSAKKPELDDAGQPVGQFDDAGNVVPQRLIGVFAMSESFKELALHLHRAADTFKKIEESPAKEGKPLRKGPFESFAIILRRAEERARNLRPSLVCGGNEACDGCAKCRELGWLTSEQVAVTEKI